MQAVLEKAFISCFNAGATGQHQRSSIFGGWPFSFSGPSTSSSVGVSQALTIPALYNALDQITNDIAKLPKSVYQKTENGREKRSDHPVTFRINKEPNLEMTAFNFWKVMVAAAILRGNGIAKIVRSANSGALVSLEFIDPTDLRDIKKVGDTLYYYLKNEVLDQDEVFHIPGFSFNGVYGIGVIAYAMQTLNIGLQVQKFSNESFDNRGIGLGAIESEMPVHPDNKKALESAVDAKLSGPGKIKTVVLDEGMKYKSIALTPQEAAVIDQGKITVLDICRFLNISPHKVKAIDGANYNTLEFLSQEHMADSIQPWAIKCMQEADRKLLTTSEKQSGYYIHFNDNILLRADLKSKAEYYSKGTLGGWLSRNEVRNFEELNSLPGLDEPLTPVNTQLMEQIMLNIKNQQNESE